MKSARQTKKSQLNPTQSVNAVVKSKMISTTSSQNRKSIHINKQCEQLVNAKTQRELMKVLKKQNNNSLGGTVALSKVSSVQMP